MDNSCTRAVLCPSNSALPIVPFLTSPPGNSILRLTDPHDNSEGPLLSGSVLPSPSTPGAPALASLRCFRFLKKMNAAIKRAKSTARGIPTPRPIFAAVESPLEDDESGTGATIDSEPADREGCCLLEDPVLLAPGLLVCGDDFEGPVDVFAIVAETLLVVVISAKSSALYLIPGRKDVSTHFIVFSSREIQTLM